ncbi:hypothetical protein HX817_00780 [Pseudomonas sp. C6002]|uniref:hypothetical protein n=1 Tax=Pseudomonas sp. C6002 TaxID=2738814 RepID=UPI0015A0F036|nr:hypothetical protein [Pseudomonas sp. C6002]NWA30054.1 hypothetical protein [Pseudomonas sp. C6002]
MRKLLVATGLAFLLSGNVQSAEEKLGPLESEMAGQVYLCGLNAQLADGAKEPKKKAYLEDANKCEGDSKAKIKQMVKAEYSKYQDGDAVRLRLKALYSAYLTYMDAAMWGKDLVDSKEAMAFKDRVSEYRAELELR